MCWFQQSGSLCSCEAAAPQRPQLGSETPQCSGEFERATCSSPVCYQSIKASPSCLVSRSWETPTEASAAPSRSWRPSCCSTSSRPVTSSGLVSLRLWTNQRPDSCGSLSMSRMTASRSSMQVHKLRLLVSDCDLVTLFLQMLFQTAAGNPSCFALMCVCQAAEPL